MVVKTPRRLGSAASRPRTAASDQALRRCRHFVEREQEQSVMVEEGAAVWTSHTLKQIGFSPIAR